MTPFFILSLGRSRSFWLSKLLSDDVWTVEHEWLRHARSLNDIKTMVKIPYKGYCETLAVPFWRTILRLSPESPIVIIHREPKDVIESYLAVDLKGVFTFDKASLSKHVYKMALKLDQIVYRVPKALSIIDYDLDDFNVCNKISYHCKNSPISPSNNCFSKILTANLADLFRQTLAFKSPLDNLAIAARQDQLRFFSSKNSKGLEGIEITNESFDSFLSSPSSPSLFAEHAISVGEAPDSYLTKNLPLWREIEARGNLLVTTARSNERLFGYLLSLVSPSLEHNNKLSATHTLFFASSQYPGLGKRLQLFANQTLQSIGVTEVWLRSGTRGNGPRMAKSMMRLGAEFSGNFWKLELPSAPHKETI